MEGIQDVVTETSTLRTRGEASPGEASPGEASPGEASNVLERVMSDRPWQQRAPMAHSPLNDRFRDLGLAYVMSPAESARLSKSVAVVRRLLKFALRDETYALRLIGSHVRHTRVAPQFDDRACVDGLVCFRTDRRSPAECLTLLQSVMDAWLPADLIRTNPYGVEIDMLGHRLRLLPGLQTRDGQVHVADLYWSGQGAQEPDAAGDSKPWVAIDPGGRAAAIRAGDHRHNGLISPVIRILKTWNIHAGRPFAGFEIEDAVLAQRFRSTRQLTFMTLEAMGGLPAPKGWDPAVRTTILDLQAAAKEACALERARRFDDAMDVMTPHLMPERTFLTQAEAAV